MDNCRRMIQERDYRIGHLFLGIVVLTWGANFGIVKSAFDTIPPLLFGALRFTVMGILLLALTFFREKGIRIPKGGFGEGSLWLEHWASAYTKCYGPSG